MPDSVVIGAGPNGLVAANLLADAGWSVEVLEAQPHPGGAVRSDRGVHPDYVSDLFNAFCPLAAASPVLARLELAAEGLRWSHAPSVLAHPLTDGRGVGPSRSRPGPSLFTPFPPVRSGLRLATKLRAAGGLRLARRLALPVRRLGEEEFAGDGGRLLLAGNALHADLAPEAVGSGGFGWLMSMPGQSHGFPVPVGGAGALTSALVSRLQRRGGVLRCSERVASVVVRGGRAVGVRTGRGDRDGAAGRTGRHVATGPVPGPRGRGEPPGPPPAGPGTLPVGLRHVQGRLGADRPGAVDGAASCRGGGRFTWPTASTGCPGSPRRSPWDWSPTNRSRCSAR